MSSPRSPNPGAFIMLPASGLVIVIDFAKFAGGAEFVEKAFEAIS